MRGQKHFGPSPNTVISTDMGKCLGRQNWRASCGQLVNIRSILVAPGARPKPLGENGSSYSGEGQCLGWVSKAKPNAVEKLLRSTVFAVTVFPKALQFGYEMFPRSLRVEHLVAN